MLPESRIQVGAMVHYKPDYGRVENGIIKRLHPSKAAVWVVYNCANDWKHYQDYTAALTNLNDLYPGWVNEGV